MLKVEKQFDIKFLQVRAGVRYWEDATVDGIEDDGSLIPCRHGDYWTPLIDVDNGQILNWKEGVRADIHYKVCDDGVYCLMDKEEKVIKRIEGYVPKIMCPEENGFGDYIIMNVDEKGFIANWEPSIDEFIEDED